jgi:hypothetical protein
MAEATDFIRAVFVSTFFNSLPSDQLDESGLLLFALRQTDLWIAWCACSHFLALATNTDPQVPR